MDHGGLDLGLVGMPGRLYDGQADSWNAAGCGEFSSFHVGVVGVGTGD